MIFNQYFDISAFLSAVAWINLEVRRGFFKKRLLVNPANDAVEENFLARYQALGFRQEIHAVLAEVRARFIFSPQEACVELLSA
jgi:hypothetical protein